MVPEIGREIKKCFQWKEANNAEDKAANVENGAEDKAANVENGAAMLME